MYFSNALLLNSDYKKEQVLIYRLANIVKRKIQLIMFKKKKTKNILKRIDQFILDYVPKLVCEI